VVVEICESISPIHCEENPTTTKLCFHLWNFSLGSQQNHILRTIIGT